MENVCFLPFKKGGQVQSATVIALLHAFVMTFIKLKSHESKQWIASK